MSDSSCPSSTIFSAGEVATVGIEISSNSSLLVLVVVTLLSFFVLLLVVCKVLCSAFGLVDDLQ